MKHSEGHRSDRIGWLRAAVLGANDGIVSTASLVVGVAASNADATTILIAAAASLVAGAMSMAAGEYVSVSSQADTEHADLERERDELEANVAHERRELTGIYVDRGLSRDLAHQVATELMDHDALGAHARDELGITIPISSRPIQAALTSALTFSVGGVVPLLTILAAPTAMVIHAVVATALLSLAVLGGLAAWTGGATLWRGVARVTFWGALAMAATAAVGAAFGTLL